MQVNNNSLPKSIKHSKVLETSRQRLMVVIMCFAFTFMAIIFRLFDVAALSGRMTVKETLYSKPVILSRREIVDRNGELLATNLQTASLYANPKVMLDIKNDLRKLVTVLPSLDVDHMEKRLAPDKHFVWIKRNLTPTEQYAVNSLGIPGLYFANEKRRVYPQGALFSHVLGYVNVDNKGISGIENALEKRLEVPQEYADEAEPLKLSMDVRIQHIVKEALAEQMEAFNAKGASGIVMDVNNGEIMAMVSLPDFDPHNPSEAEYNQKFNRSTLGVYEMGSTFKTFTMALGLEKGKERLHSRYDVSEPLRIANFTINDYHRHDGMMSVPEVFIHSSNIGTARILLDIGEEKQRPFLETLDMCKEISLELTEMANPLCPAADKWGRVSALTISYGHGIAVTPLHVARATSAMVNGGFLYNPTLVKLRDNEEISGKKVVEKETSDYIRKLMRLAVTYGTGARADARGYLVGGKTGSADKAVNGGYKSGGRVTSFVGAFPMHDPKYVVFVLMDDPHADRVRGILATGGSTAAPAVRNIIAKIGPMLGVNPILEETLDIRTDLWIDSEDYDRPPVARTVSF